MTISDLLVSDASSALFEFAALDKPVIWCDFYKLRWSYRGPLSYRFRSRMDSEINSYADICPHAERYEDLPSLVEDELQHPEKYSAKRKMYVRRLIGSTDGNVSKRIVNFLMDNVSHQ